VNVPQRVAFGTAVQFAARALLTVLGLVTFGLIARHLGVEAFGQYSLVLTFVPLFASIADLGVITIAVREISREPASERRVLGSVVTVKVVLGLASALILLAAVPLLPYPYELRLALALALLGLILQVLSTAPTVVFQSRLRMDLQAAVDVTIVAANLGLVLLVLVLGGGLHALILAWVASIAVGCVLAYVLAARLADLRPSWDRGTAWLLLRRALPLGLVMVLGIVHFRVDAILLSLLRPIGDVGIYNAAYKFLEQALVAPALFIAAIFPLLSAYAARADARLPATVQKALVFLLLLAMPIAVGAFVLARPIITLVAGDAFADAVTPLQILVLALVIAYASTLFVSLLIAYDLLGRLLAVSALAVGLNVALNLVAIPRWSYNGAAATTVVTEGLVTAAIAVWAIRHAGLRIDWGPAARIGVAALAMGAAATAVADLPLAVPVLAGAAVYALLVVALRVVGQRDLRVLLRGEE
jgi:O-antigen/teichoic acid export membrane protein